MLLRPLELVAASHELPGKDAGNRTHVLEEQEALLTTLPSLPALEVGVETQTQVLTLV